MSFLPLDFKRSIVKALLDINLLFDTDISAKSARDGHGVASDGDIGRISAWQNRVMQCGGVLTITLESDITDEGLAHATSGKSRKAFTDHSLITAACFTDVDGQLGFAFFAKFPASNDDISSKGGYRQHQSCTHDEAF